MKVTSRTTTIQKSVQNLNILPCVYRSFIYIDTGKLVCLKMTSVSNVSYAEELLKVLQNGVRLLSFTKLRNKIVCRWTSSPNNYDPQIRQKFKYNNICIVLACTLIYNNKWKSKKYENRVTFFQLAFSHIKIICRWNFPTERLIRKEAFVRFRLV